MKAAGAIIVAVRVLSQALLPLAVTVLGGILVLLLLLVLMCRSYDKPGEGPTAAAGYRWGTPVVAALESYHRDYGRYPDSMLLLRPRYIANEALTPPPPLSGSVAYQLDHHGGYSLSFFYTPPSSTCTYTPANGRWNCSAAW